MTVEMINGIVLGSMVTIPICILFWLLLMFYRGWSNLWNRKYKELHTQMQHQKYKRCMAMARWCMARYNEYAAYYPTTTTRGMKFLDKWEKRWRRLAEKIKESYHE